jgi:O-antigen ligase
MLYRFNQVSYDNSVNSREETWNAATQLIAEQGVFGTGSGDAQADLNTIYAKNGFELGVKENHNAHNQYLQIIIESGLPGFLMFLLIIGICLAYAWRQPDKKYLLFLIIFLFSMLTEAMLETQSGVVFFVIFNCIFLSAERPRQN